MGAEKHADRPGRGGRWAWILLQFGAEDDVNAYCNWFVAKLRAQGADKLYQMQQFWLQSAWRMAMGMRSGRTFGEVTQEIRSDLPSLQQALQKPKKQPRQPTQVGEDRGHRAAQGPRPRGKGKGKGKEDRPGKGQKR